MRICHRFMNTGVLLCVGLRSCMASGPKPDRHVIVPAVAQDRWPRPFKRMVILGESTVRGGSWLAGNEERYPDTLAGLINEVQEQPVEYINKGIGANAISPRSPGYPNSAKPSAMERYEQDVIANKTFEVLANHCSGLSQSVNAKNEQSEWARKARAAQTAATRPAR